MAELYTALKQAGAEEASARWAAGELAACETFVSNLGSDIKVLMWMVGFNIAITLAAFGRLVPVPH